MINNFNLNIFSSDFWILPQELHIIYNGYNSNASNSFLIYITLSNMDLLSPETITFNLMVSSSEIKSLLKSFITITSFNVLNGIVQKAKTSLKHEFLTPYMIKTFASSIDSLIFGTNSYLMKNSFLIPVINHIENYLNNYLSLLPEIKDIDEVKERILEFNQKGFIDIGPINDLILLKCLESNPTIEPKDPIEKISKSFWKKVFKFHHKK